MTITALQSSTAIEAVIYCRVSTRHQLEEGHGLDGQETKCREYAERRGLPLRKVFYDRAVSGGKLHRPSFEELLRFVRKNGSENMVVIIDDISRFARDIKYHWELRDALKATGGKLESLTLKFGEDADSILLENLLASVSQHQRQKGGELTKSRMQARAMAGYWVFHAPPGYRYEDIKPHGKLLVRDEPVASIVQEALESYASGRFDTQAEIKRFLDSKPEYPRRNRCTGEVTYEEVSRLLNRPHYAGYIEVPSWNIALRKGHHEPLISLETYERIQARIKEGARVPARKNISADFPLRGFITCADCGNPLTANWSKSKTGARHPYYMCFTKGCASYRKSIRRADLGGEFEGLVKTLRPAPKLFHYFSVIFKREWERRLDQMGELKRTLRREILKIDKQVEHLLDRIVETDSATSITAYERRIARLERDKLLKEEKLTSGTAPRQGFREMFELAFTFLANPWKIWESEHLENKRTVLKLAFEDRIAYCRNQGLRTPKTTLPFKVLGHSDAQK